MRCSAKRPSKGPYDVPTRAGPPSPRGRGFCRAKAAHPLVAQRTGRPHGALASQGRISSAEASPSGKRRRSLGFAVLLAVLTPLAAGCGAYRMGVRSLYPTDIQTVYVPMVESASFRRNLGEQLTEALVRQINAKTPLRVVDSPQADSVLNVTLVSDTKRVTVVSPTDEPRETNMNYQVRVAWVSRHGDMLAQDVLPLAPELAITDVGQDAYLYTEIGQTVLTTQLQIAERLAEQIVGLMEAPW